MSATPETDLRYPVGKFQMPATIALEDREQWLETLADLPENLRNAVLGWNEHRLDTNYREGGWTVRQLLHHIADSHMNAYVRIRLALTEDWPTIKPYDEGKWAQLHDAKVAPVEWSLELIESLHARWVMLFESLQAEDWKRGYKHPESGAMTVEQVLALYAWHSRHHTAHITHLQQRMGW
ncbi:MAG: YfiT family bacillithiol transferase [Acidobacteriaceae bacterium]